jgi:hypothetical protein
MVYEIKITEEDGTENTQVIVQEDLKDFLESLEVGMIDEWLVKVEINLLKKAGTK